MRWSTLLIVWLLCVTTVRSQDVCKALAGFAADTPVIDGLSGSSFSDLTWVNAQCAGNSINYDSGWISVSTSSVHISFDQTAVVNTASFQKILQVNNANGNLQSLITLNFQIGYTSTLPGQSVRISFAGTISKYYDAPLIAASDFNVPWNGKITTDCQTGYAVSDGNLFDGAMPMVTFNCSTASSNGLALQMMEAARFHFANLNMRFDALTSMPSSLQETIRGRFLSPSKYPAVLESEAYQITLDGTTGILLRSATSCSDAACPELLVQALLTTISNSTKDSCSSISLVPGTLYSQLTSELFASTTGSLMYLRGASGTTQALFSCGSDYIGISLRVISPSQKLSLGAFSDYQAAAMVINSLRLVPHGTIAGTIHTPNGTIQRLPSADLFSAIPAGFSMPDQLVVASRVANLFSQFRSLLSTGIVLLDNYVASLFPSDPQLLINQFSSQVQVPTFIEFFLWFAETHPDVQVFFTADGSQMKVLVGLRMQVGVPISDSTTIGKINNELNLLGQKTKSTYNEYTFNLVIPQVSQQSQFTSATLDGYLTGPLSVDLSTDSVQTESTKIFGATVFASMDFTNTMPRSMFPTATVTYDYVEQYSTIQATVYGNITTVTGGKLGLDDSGNLVNNLPFPINSNVQQITYIASDIANDPYTWQGTTMEPMNFVPASFGSNTAADTISGLADKLQSIASGTGCLNVAQRLTDYLRSLGSAYQTINIHAVPHTDGSIQFRILVTTLEKTVQVATRSTPWDFVVDMQRLHFPIILKTEITFWVNSGSRALQNFAVIGSSYVSGFNVPVQSGMKTGTEQVATLVLALNLPTSTLNITIIAQDNALNDTMTCQIIGSQMNTDEATVYSKISTQKDRKVNPSAVFPQIRDVILRLIPNFLCGPFNTPVTPFADSFCDLDYMSNDTSAVVIFMSSTAASSAQVLAQSENLSPGDLSGGLMLNITLNQFNTSSCWIPSLDTSSLENIAKSVDNGLKSCNFGPYLTAQVISQEPSSSDGTIGLFTVVQGVTYSLKVVSQGAFALNGVWQAQTVAAFGNWEDLSWMISAAFTDSESYYPVKYEMIPYDTVAGMVPPALREVYPTEFPAVSLTMTFQSENEALSSMVQQLQANDSVQVFVATDAKLFTVVKNRMTADLVFAFEAAPQGGASNITIFSNFTYGTNLSSLIVVPNNNTFTLGIYFQQRFPNGTVFTQYVEQLIQLPEGKSLMDAMFEDVIPQMPAFMQPVMAVGISPANPTANSTDRFMITIRRLPAESGSWLVPLSLGIVSSSTDGWSICTNMPSTFRAISEYIALSVEVTANADASNATGSVGPVDLSTNTVNGQAYILLQMNQTNPATMSRLTKISANSSTWFDFFNAQVKVNSTLAFPDLTYDLTSTDLLDSEISFKSDTTTTLKSLTDLSMLGPKISMQANFDETATMEKVMLLATPVWCNVLYDLTNVTSKIVNNTQQPLPFSTISLGQMFDKAVASRVSTIQNNVCSGNQNLTIDTLCKLFESAFGKPVCTSKSLENNMLEVVIDIVGFNITFANSFLFNTSYYLGADLPMGIGTDGDLSMFALFTIKIVLQADLNGNPKNPTVNLGSQTKFTLQTGLDVDGKLKSYFGPISASFSNLQLHVGPVIMTTTMVHNKDISLQINGTALMDTVINFPRSVNCRLNLNFPDLFGKPTWSGDNFIEIFAKVLKDSSLFDFISDPSMFVSQLVTDTEELVDNIFGGNGMIGPLRIPLVASRLEKVLSKGIQKLFDPNTTRDITSGFANTTTEILQKGLNYTEEKINELVLKKVTEILCKSLQPIMRGPCPQVPNSHSDTYLWNFTLGENVSEEVKDVDFDVGGHGFAGLNMDCGIMLHVDWWLNVTFSYTKDKGLKFLFDREPTLLATANLDFAPTCELSGKIGLLGADLKPSGGLLGTLIVHANFADASVNVTAHMEAQAILGFAGPLSKMTINTLEALPYWQASLVLDWYWNLNSPDTTPSFKVMNTSMCLGHILGKMLSSVAGQIKKKVLDPLDIVLGPSGILLTPIPTTKFLLGVEMNAIQLEDFIFNTFCEDDCEFSNVYEALQTYLQILDLIKQFDNMLTIFGDSPCGSFQQIQDWSVDFTLADPIPRIDPNSIVIPDIQFEPGIPYDQRQQTITLVNSINSTGAWGITMPLFHNVPNNILNLILGKKNIPLVEVMIPALSMGSMAHVSVPVWPVPYVELDFGYSCKLTVDIGKVVLLMNGLVDAVESENVGKLFNGLGIPVKNDDGSPKYPIYGYIRLEGGVSVSIFIFRGSAYAWIELDGKMTFLEINGDGYLTFDEVVWILKNNDGNFLKILDVDLELKGGFGISIQACIRILWKRKCWTITKQEWSATLWHKEFVSKSVNQLVLPTGDVNMPLLLTDLFGGGTIATLRLWDRDGQITADGFPPGVDPSSDSAPLVNYLPPIAIGYKDLSGDPTFMYQLNGIRQRVTFPPSANGVLKFVMDSKGYRKVLSYTLNPNSITPATTYGTAASKCQSIQFVNPVYGTSFYLVDGIVCQMQADVDSATVSVSGSPYGFNGKPINIDGTPYLIDVSIPAPDYHIYGNKILTQDLNMNFATSRLVQVSGPIQTNATFTIYNTPAATTMTVTGGNSPDRFVIPDLSQIIGSLSIQGGAQKNGANEFALNIFTSQGNLFTYTPGSVVQSGGTQTHYVDIYNVDEQNIVIKGTGLQGTIVSPARDTNLNIYVEGQPGGVNVLNITGCNGHSNIRVYLSGGGLMQVNLGSSNQISDFFCVVWIYGSSDPEQTDSVTFQSSNEQDFLKWDLSTAGSLVVRNPTDVNSFLVVQFEAVDQMTFEMSEAGNEVAMVGTTPTEMHFKFPEAPSYNSIHVKSSTNAVVISGTCSVLIGPDPKPWYTYPPLRDLSGPVIFLGNMDITMNSGVGANASSQRYQMDESCLDYYDATGKTNNVTEPTDWICGITDSYGLACRMCQVQYQGRIGLWLSTGGGNDTFIGTNVRATVNASLDSGRDVLQWSTSNFTANFDMGVGADNVTLVVPISPVVQVWLGDDRDVDIITVYTQGRYAVGWDGSVVTHSGPGPNDKVIFYDYRNEDKKGQFRLPRA